MWQMSTIWADTVDQARDAARKFVYAGLSDKGDLYGLHDCVYNYESVKVLQTMSAVAVCMYHWHGSRFYLSPEILPCILHLRTSIKQLHVNLSQCLDVDGLQSVDIEALKVLNQCYDRAFEVCNMLLS